MHDRIAEIFNGRTVLITGASGFLGKVLLEKILRRCKDVKTVYLLLRGKKGKTCEERMNNISNGVLFESLKDENPCFFEKCKVISGDISSVDLKISPEDRKTLEEEVEFIFHSAAITRFDQPAVLTVETNTRGTKCMLDLAQQCHKLQVFVYVSTAYSHPQEKVLEEKAYEVRIKPSDVLSLLESSGNSDFTNQKLSELMSDFPNAYSFSKALSEDLVVQKMEKLPAIIVRPSIVAPINKDPLPGWTDSLQGAMGILMGAGKGVFRTMYMRVGCRADFAPADVVINGILISTWNYLTFNKNQRFFNLTASSKTHKTWGEVIDFGKHVTKHIVPCNRVIWCPGGFGTQSRTLYLIRFYLFQMIPAIFIDLILAVLGYKPFLYRLQKLFQSSAPMLEFYTISEWEFVNNRLMEIQARLNKKEKEIYHFDDEFTLDYAIQCVLGSRRYIFNETDDMLPAAKRNMKILLAVDYVCTRTFLIIVLYYFYKWLVSPLVQMWL